MFNGDIIEISRLGEILVLLIALGDNGITTIPNLFPQSIGLFLELVIHSFAMLPYLYFTNWNSKYDDKALELISL